MREFLLNCSDVLRSSNPHKTVMDFLQNADAAATAEAGWDDASLTVIGSLRRG
jgi:hypothetical protein